MPTGISDKDVLSVISDSDLRTFVRQELRRNKYLSLRLKARHIDKITVERGANKYMLLLDELLRLDTTGRLRLTGREAKLLNEIVQRLLTLAKTFRETSSYREAHRVLQPVITRLHQFLDKQGVPDVSLVERLKEANKELDLLVQMPMAPELRATIFAYCMDLITTSYFRMYDTQANLVAVMRRAMDDFEQPEQLLQAILRKLEVASDRTFWAVWLFVARTEVNTPPEPAVTLPIEQLHGIAGALHAMSHDEALALCIAENYDREGLSPRQRLQWTEWMFDLASRGTSEHMILEWGLELIRQSGDTDVFDEIARVLADAKHPHDLVQRITATGDLHLTGLLLSSQEEWQELLELISERGSVTVLTQHLAALLEHLPGATRTAIPGVLMHYVTHHAGLSCGESVHAFLEALRTSSAADMQDALQSQLRTAFPGRFPIQASGVQIS